MSRMKVVIASIVVVAALIFGGVSFVQTNVEYTDFQTAMTSHKRVQVKGEWVREKESRFDPEKHQFTFTLKDDNDDTMRVVLEGAKPNNFDIANAVVVKGRYDNGFFHATDCLTKCPSKYEASPTDVQL